MRRRLLLAPWLMCAFALSTADVGSERAGVRSAVAQAECTSNPTAGCVSYSQKMKQRSIQISLRSRCKEEMSCTVSWRLKCDGEAKARPGSSIFTLMPKATEVITASAAACGEKGWEIRQVRWNCKSDD